MRFALGWLMLTGTLLTADSASISGTVTDSATHQPISDARVELRYSTSSAAIRTATSDKTGAFRFEVEEPGNYVVDASAENYLDTQYRMEQPVVQFDESDFAPGHPPVERSTVVSIARAAQISGVLKNGDTQKPLEGFSVKPLRITWSRGKREFHEQGLANTDEKGTFRAAVPPGDYILQIWKAPSPNRVVAGREPDYSAKFPRTEAFPLTLWPRGEPDSVIPFAVAGGIENSIGAIDISKISLGRIRGAIPASQCNEGDHVSISFSMISINDNALRGTLQLPCDEPFTITDLAPGKYRVIAMTIPANATGGIAYPRNGPGVPVVQIEAELREALRFRMSRTRTAEVQILEGTDEELALNSSFAPVQDLDVKLTCDCSEDKLPSVRRAGSKPGEIELAIVDAGQKAQPFSGPGFIGVSMERAQVTLSKLPPGYAIKEVLSNGVSTGGLFIPDPNLEKQSLNVILTDKPAHLTVSVVRDDKPVPGAHLVAARWPIERAADFPVYVTSECDSEGKCVMDSLSPTAWRVAAIPAEVWYKLDMPGVLERWLSAGEDLTLLPGESQALRIEPRD